MAKLRVTLKCSIIGCPQNRRSTVEAPDLTKINSSVAEPSNKVIRDVINTVSHLVDAEEI